MKIVIIAGGTGSIALQGGLYHMLDRQLGDDVETKVLVNAYDNGLSTGMVRRVMSGEILGPSDVRKNQTTRLRLENPSSGWLKFLDTRFTTDTCAAKDFCIGEIKKLEALPGIGSCALLYGAVSIYFSHPMSLKIDYNDFSLANIIYAGLAAMHGNSLRAAASVMAQLMGIKDNVIINDDRSMFLGARTKKGKLLLDEGDIVTWGDVDDGIEEIFFTSPQGDKVHPVLCEEARAALREADLIILSSGTQWSSLIPTYVSAGFKEAMEESTAKIVMVMNRVPDSDSPGQTASDIVKMIVPRFVPKGRVRLVLDSSGHDQMRKVDARARELLHSYVVQDIGDDVQYRIHSSDQLASAIGKAYFDDALSSTTFVFDYDDTLVGRGNSMNKSSSMNRNSILNLNLKARVAICTGNSIDAVYLPQHRVTGAKTTLSVYADCGINEYEMNVRLDSHEDAGVKKTKLIRTLSPQHIIGQPSIKLIFDALHSVGIGPAKIENRGDVMVAIRPIDPEYRTAIFHLVKPLMRDKFAMETRIAGRSTIEISRVGLSKAHAIQSILKMDPNVTYLGDELESGNDAVVKELCKEHPKLRCVKVKDPSETAFFMATLMSILS